MSGTQYSVNQFVTNHFNLYPSTGNIAIPMTQLAKSKVTPVENDKDVMVAAVLFTAVGVGYLFPFSALTQPVDYWHKIFPDFNIEFPLTTMYMWVNLIFLFLIVFFGGKPSYTFRIVGGFLGQIIVLVAVPSFYFLHLDEKTHYTMIMVATAVAAVTTAFVDSVAIGFAAQYPTRVQEALQFGIGFSTFIGSLYRVITKLVFPVEQVVESSLLYFYSGALTIALCIYAYYYLLTLPLSKRCLTYGVNDENTSDHSEGTEADTRPLIDTEAPTVGLEMQPFTSKRFTAKVTYYKDRFSVPEPAVASTVYGAIVTTNNTHEEEIPLNRTVGDPGQEANKWVLLRQVAFGESMVFVVFFSTLLLWPPLITEIKSFNFPLLQASQWWPLILLTVFSTSDCIGRLSVPFRGWLNASNIWVAVLLRFVLFPLIVCSAKGIYFTHDFYSVLFVSLLGFTNGYLGSLAIIFVSESVPEKDKGLVGMFTGFFLNMGSVFGASGACFVEKWVLQS